MGKKPQKSSFGRPSLLAQARFAVGGDWAAAMLLYRLMWRWRSNKKLQRLGRDWIAMSRSDWAREAGLSEGVMKNRALLNLRKQSYVTIRQMKLNGKKALWMSLDMEELIDQANKGNWDWYEDMLNGMKPVGHHPQPYPYQDAYIKNTPVGNKGNGHKPPSK